MQVLGWASILMGLFHFSRVSGILLVIIGVAVLLLERKVRDEGWKATLRSIQGNIQKVRSVKKEQAMVSPRDKGDFLFDASSKRSKPQPKVDKKPKPDDWLF